MAITNETLRVIKQRRSVRSFRSEQIRDDELQAVVEAGLYAPNGGGQAWHFTVVQNRELLRKLDAAAKEGAMLSGNEWLQQLAGRPGFDCLYGAPTLILVSGSQQSPIPLEADCSAAMENLLLAAESVGCGSCWIYFVTLAFDAPQGADLLKELKVPDGYRPYYGAAIGYKKGDPTTAPDRKPDLITFIR